MPILEITDGKGRLMPLPFIIPFAVMHFPDDPQKRSQFAIIEAAKHHFQETDKPFPIDKQALEHVIDMPRTEDWRRILASAYDSGESAGWILSRLIYLHEHRARDASVNKSLAVELAARKEEGKPASRAHVKRQWSGFKNVAHLWASLRTVHGNTDFTVSAAQTQQLAFLEFLAFAEEIRKRAEGIKAPGQKTPVLDPAETWKVPTDLELPEVGFRVGDAPNDALLNILRKYRAPSVT